jgi:transcriptional regulator with XRE-family HTH domain
VILSRLGKPTKARRAERAARAGSKVTGAQLRAARAFLKLSQRQLSDLSRVSSLTIVRMEATEGLVMRRAKLVDSIVAALSRRGIRFLPAGGGYEGVVLERSRPKRRCGRASKQSHCTCKGGLGPGRNVAKDRRPG